MSAPAVKRRKAAGPRQSPIVRASRNPRSLRLAINAKCFECSGGNTDPCVAWRIGNCEVGDCSLWPQRPHQNTFGRNIPVSLRKIGWR